MWNEKWTEFPENMNFRLHRFNSDSNCYVSYIKLLFTVSYKNEPINTFIGDPVRSLVSQYDENNQLMHFSQNQTKLYIIKFVKWVENGVPQNIHLPLTGFI